MHGQFVREILEKVAKNRTWQCSSKSDLKIGTKPLLCAAQEQFIATNYVKHNIEKTSESPMCRLCEKKVKMCYIQEVDARKQLIKNIRDDTKMQQRNSIEIFVRRMGQGRRKNGMNTSQKEGQKMKK